MFAATRQRLAGAWRRLREGSLVRLFLFEFVVVLLGVLAAQWLAEWSNDRQAVRAMEDARARLDRDLAMALPTMDIWAKAIPCLDVRMDEILRASAAQRTLAPGDLRRPRFFGAGDQTVPPETMALIGRVHGAEVADYYERSVDKASQLSKFSDAIAAQWQQFALINPDYGSPTGADFHAARAAAGHIKSELVSAQIAVDNYLYATRKLGIVSVPNDLNRVAVPDCATIWREGTIHVDAETGRGAIERFKEPR